MEEGDQPVPSGRGAMPRGRGALPGRGLSNSAGRGGAMPRGRGGPLSPRASDGQLVVLGGRGRGVNTPLTEPSQTTPVPQQASEQPPVAAGPQQNQRPGPNPALRGRGGTVGTLGRGRAGTLRFPSRGGMQQSPRSEDQVLAGAEISQTQQVQQVQPVQQVQQMQPMQQVQQVQQVEQAELAEQLVQQVPQQTQPQPPQRPKSQVFPQTPETPTEAPEDTTVGHFNGEPDAPITGANVSPRPASPRGRGAPRGPGYQTLRGAARGGGPAMRGGAPIAGRGGAPPLRGGPAPVAQNPVSPPEKPQAQTPPPLPQNRSPALPSASSPSLQSFAPKPLAPQSLAPQSLAPQLDQLQPSEGVKSSIQSIADAAKEAAAAGQQIHIIDKSTVNQLEYSQREITAIHDLLKFFATKSPSAIQFLYENTPKGAEQTSLASSLVNLSFSPKVTITLFDFLLEDEFASNSSAGKEILRENGMVIQFLKSYLKIVGGDFLKVVLSGLVKSLCVNEKKTSFEIDPSRAPPDEIEANMNAFVDKMQQFIDYMTSKQVLDAMPPGIRVLAQIVSKKSQQYRPTHKNIYIGSFLMLRFINPALFTPENFDLLPRGLKTPDAIPRRNMVLISKVLQNIANGIKASKKEPWMAAIDLEKWQTKIYDWFDNITGVQFNPETVHEKTVLATQVSDLHALHCLVFKFKKQLSGIVDKNDQKDFKAILDRLGDYANKTAFEKLDPKDRKMVKSFLDSRLSAENPSQIKEEATYIGYLNVTIKGKSKGKMVTEKTILILGTFQVWLLTTAGKLVVVQNLLKLEQIKSEAPDKLTLVFGLADPLAGDPGAGQSEKQLLVGESADVDNIILTIQRSYEYNYSGMSLGKRFKMSIAPPERAAQLTSIVHKSDEPCGGLVPTYRALCHFWSTPVVEAVCWDIEHLYANNTVLDFDRFTKLYLKPFSDIHAGPFFHALGYNRYFTELILKNFKFNDESTVAGILQLVSNNSTVEKLTFSDISGPGLTPKMLCSMFTAITDNTRLNLTHLDLSYTQIPDGPVNGLYQYFLVKQTSLTYLDLTGCFKDKATKMILSGLTKNKKCTRDLKTLKWGDTKLTEMSGELGRVLANMTGLLELFLRDTQIVLSELLAPMDGECKKLKTLDLANNKMPRANQWDGLLAFMRNSKNSLYEINIMNTNVPPEFLSELLCCPSDSPFAFKVAGNPLGSSGADILAKCASKINCDKLDISDTSPTDEGLAAILDGLAANATLTSLDISFDYDGSGGSEAQKKVANALCNFAKSICPVEVFKFCGAEKKTQGILANRPRLREAVVPFLLALGTKATLTTLDMSGHGFGDAGAIALSRLIQQSHSLTAVEYDDNNITIVGLANIASVLGSHSHNIRNMPVPMMDVSKLLQEAQSGSKQFQQLMPILHSLENITQMPSSTSSTPTGAI